MTIRMPQLRDPNYLQGLIIVSYSIAAREIYHFERTHLITLVCLAWSLLLDYLLGAFYFRNYKLRPVPFLLAFSSTLLINAQSVYPYLMVVTLANLSKAFLRFEGRHVYNPVNFGVSLVLLLMPNFATGMPALFSGGYAVSLIFLVLGIANSAWAHQMTISLSFFSGFLMLGCARAFAFDAPLLNTLEPCLGPSFLLFTFHMITDPRTVPENHVHRIFFGFAIATFDAIFRILQIPYGIFYSLLIALSLLPAFSIKLLSLPGLAKGVSVRNAVVQVQE